MTANDEHIGIAFSAIVIRDGEYVLYCVTLSLFRFLPGGLNTQACKKAARYEGRREGGPGEALPWITQNMELKEEEEKGKLVSPREEEYGEEKASLFFARRRREIMFHEYALALRQWKWQGRQ